MSASAAPTTESAEAALNHPVLDDAAAPQLAGTPVKLIASDIDGTILSYKLTASGAVSPRTVEAFQAASEAGVAVVLVTGRPVRNMRPVSDTLGEIGPVICSNGAVMYDLAQDRLVSSWPMQAEALFSAKDIILDLDPGAFFAAETLEHLHLEDGFAKDSLFYDDAKRKGAGIGEEQLLFGPLDETLERGTRGEVRTPDSEVGQDHVADRVVKLLVKTHSMDPDAFLAEVRRRAGHLVSVTHSAPGVSLLELAAKGINKAAGLQRFATSLGVNQQNVVAFGDMPNDIEMLQWVGTSWAVGSAHPMARAAANHVTSSCDDDGVAVIIEKLLAGQL